MCRTSSVASCEDQLGTISRETEPECDGEAAATGATRLTLASESRGGRQVFGTPRPGEKRGQLLANVLTESSAERLSPVF